MAGREELYLKHIDENTAKIAKSLGRMVECQESIIMDKEPGAEHIYLRAVKDMVKYIEDQDVVAKTTAIRWQNQVKRAKTRPVKYVDQCSPEHVRGILEDFAAYYAGYAITDDQNAKADEIFEAIDKYMDLREATK